MAKQKYNPLQAIQGDPLASLKQATAERSASDVPPTLEDSSTPIAPKDDEKGRESSSGRDPASVTERENRSSAPVKPLSSTLKPSRNTVYLYPEDTTKLRQLLGYASMEHGIRANDSMIVRAALSLVDADVRFLHALKEAVLSDRRRTSRQI